MAGWLGGKLVTGIAFKRTDFQHFAEIAQRRLVIEHSVLVELPESGEDEAAMPRFAETAEHVEDQITLFLLVCDETVGFVNQEDETLPGVTDALLQ